MTAAITIPGPHPIEQYTFDWHNPTRHREVPVRVYCPADDATSWPLVIFSHGTGSTRDGYTYLGRHWASHGYVVAHPTHIGSDRATLRGEGVRGLTRRLAQVLADVEHRHERPRDVSFVISQILADPQLAPRIDAARIAAAGHSYGAYSALTMLGLRDADADRRNVRFTDARVRVAIAMSPQSEANLGLYERSWAQIDRPVLAITGTRDYEYGIGTAARRRTSFDRTPGPDQYLLAIDGATHATFDDKHELAVPVRPPDPRHHDWIRQTTTAFLDAHLCNDKSAQKWLFERKIEQESAGACKLEHKNVTRPVQP